MTEARDLDTRVFRAGLDFLRGTGGPGDQGSDASKVLVWVGSNNFGIGVEPHCDSSYRDSVTCLALLLPGHCAGWALTPGIIQTFSQAAFLISKVPPVRRCQFILLD